MRSVSNVAADAIPPIHDHIDDQHIEAVTDRAGHTQRPPLLIVGHDSEQ